MRRCKRKASCRAIDGGLYCPNHVKKHVAPKPQHPRGGRRCSCKTREGLRCSRHTRTKFCWQHTQRCLGKWGPSRGPLRTARPGHRSTQTSPQRHHPTRSTQTSPQKHRSTRSTQTSPQTTPFTQHRSAQTSPFTSAQTSPLTSAQTSSQIRPLPWHCSAQLPNPQPRSPFVPNSIHTWLSSKTFSPKDKNKDNKNNTYPADPMDLPTAPNVNNVTGNEHVLATDTTFIDPDWLEVDRPSDEELHKYRYLESERRRNGTVPRAYHENAIRGMRSGHTRGRNPITRQQFDSGNVRRFRPPAPSAPNARTPRNINNVLGNGQVIAEDTVFIGGDWIDEDRPSNEDLQRYRYLESERRQNGTVPRAYHEDAIRAMRLGNTQGQNPMSQRSFSSGNVRRFPPGGRNQKVLNLLTGNGNHPDLINFSSSKNQTVPNLLTGNGNRPNMINFSNRKVPNLLTGNGTHPDLIDFSNRKAPNLLTGNGNHPNMINFSKPKTPNLLTGNGHRPNMINFSNRKVPNLLAGNGNHPNMINFSNPKTPNLLDFSNQKVPNLLTGNGNHPDMINFSTSKSQKTSPLRFAYKSPQKLLEWKQQDPIQLGWKDPPIQLGWKPASPKRSPLRLGYKSPQKLLTAGSFQTPASYQSAAGSFQTPASYQSAAGSFQTSASYQSAPERLRPRSPLRLAYKSPQKLLEWKQQDPIQLGWKDPPIPLGWKQASPKQSPLRSGYKSSQTRSGASQKPDDLPDITGLFPNKANADLRLPSPSSSPIPLPFPYTSRSRATKRKQTKQKRQTRRLKPYGKHARYAQLLRRNVDLK
jgi:hypothetical protein